MQTFTLAELFRIKDIGAASGLVCKANLLLIISDNSNCLFEYDMQFHTLKKTVIVTDKVFGNIPKKRKPDFEAITLHDEKLYIFGSGSTENRNTLIVVDQQKTISKHDLSALYAQMQNAANIQAEEFNIEGVASTGNDWYFFQRGNGIAGKNGIFSIHGNILDTVSIAYKAINLPNIGRIPGTFTDAVFVGDRIYFLATAEDSNSVYQDGEILGSLIGCIETKNLEVISYLEISSSQKFEGISFLEKNETEIAFLLCEDNDTDALESGIYKLVLRL